MTDRLLVLRAACVPAVFVAAILLARSASTETLAPHIFGTKLVDSINQNKPPFNPVNPYSTPVTLKGTSYFEQALLVYIVNGQNEWQVYTCSKTPSGVVCTCKYLQETRTLR
jgi:hypothetical protein